MRPVHDVLLALSRSGAMKRLVSSLPVSSGLVRGYVAGDTVRDAVHAVESLASHGLLAGLELLGDDPADVTRASATVQAHRILLDRIADAGLAARADVTVRATSLGLRLAGGERVALECARKVARAASGAGTTMTLVANDPASTDATLDIVRALRADFPDTGVALDARLRRTEADCRELAHAGSRVRLWEGTGDLGGDEGAYAEDAEVDRSYVRCLKALFAGEGHPMVATDDPRLIEITGALASRYGRAPGTYEFQLAYAVRPAEQRRLAASGERVRVLVPYGEEWYGYVVRRLAERPRDLSLFVTSLVSKK